MYEFVLDNTMSLRSIVWLRIKFETPGFVPVEIQLEKS